MRVDTLIENAIVLTQDDRLQRARSVAIWRGRIIAVDADCSNIEADRTVNADGAIVVPGFNDPHAHSVWFGNTLNETNLAACKSFDDLYARIAADAAQRDASAWVIASGYNQMDTGGTYPDPDTLDRVAGGRPVWIKHTSGHSCIVNRKALDMLGIDGSEVFSGGAVVVDDSGSPTGVLEEAAMTLVQDHMLPESEDQIVAALDAATQAYASEGLTSITDAGIGGGWIGHSAAEFAAYQTALERGVLRTRMQAMLASDVLQDVELDTSGAAFHGLPGGLRTGLGNTRLQLGPVKIFIDGSILGNTARVSQAYDNCSTNYGYYQGDVDQMRDRAIRAGRAGWALAMHAVGDEAVDVAIDILRQLDREGITPPMMHRVEHGVLASVQQLDALASLNATIVSQPYLVQVYGDGFRTYVGDERANTSYGFASMIQHGMLFVCSSDRPVADGKPLAVMQAAVERRTESGWVYGADERISAQHALRGYTRGPAELTGFGTEKGRIAPGFLADLTFLADDPTTVASHRISQIEVLGTVMNGDATYDPHGIWTRGK